MSKKVVIIGGGFAGLSAAKVLGNARDIEVVLIDRSNHHLFQPLLYQVATAGLSPSDIAVPIRSVLSSYKNVEVVLDEVVCIERSERCVRTAGGQALTYDYLIVAGGANHSYFGKDHWEKFAPGPKTLEQAIQIRQRILLAFEEAEKERSLEKIKSKLTFVVVGGGPTGVEMAGSIAELCKTALSKDFRRIGPEHAQVLLIEAGPRILPMFDPSLSARAMKDLKAMGVDVRVASAVQDITEKGVQLKDQFIPSQNVIWAAGVAPSPLGKMLNAELDKIGRVLVDSKLNIANDPCVFVLGDMASFMDKDKKALPGLASVALQQGRHTGRQIKRLMNKEPVRAFRYVDKGSMATIGRKRAVLQKGKIKASGFPAWIAWLAVHIYFLIGFKNRFLVLFQWAWSYFTFKRGSRLIISRR